jgi:hypothetical protein
MTTRTPNYKKSKSYTEKEIKERINKLDELQKEFEIREYKKFKERKKDENILIVLGYIAIICQCMTLFLNGFCSLLWNFSLFGIAICCFSLGNIQKLGEKE